MSAEATGLRLPAAEISSIVASNQEVACPLFGEHQNFNQKLHNRSCHTPEASGPQGFCRWFHFESGTQLLVKPRLRRRPLITLRLLPSTTLLHRTLEATNCSKRHHVLAVLLVGSDPFDAVAPKSVDASSGAMESMAYGIHWRAARILGV